MTEYEIIRIDISPTGKVMVTTEGFVGKACFAATQEFEQSLGKVTNITPTEEMKTEEVVQKNVTKRKQ